MLGLGISLTSIAIHRRGGPSAPATLRVVIAPLLGQSNSVGRVTNDGLDINISDIYQFGGNSGQVATYQQIVADITPLHPPDNTFDRVGPGINYLAKLKALYPGAKIVGVPCGVGSTGMVGMGWQPALTPGAGGAAFEFAVNQTIAAKAAALAMWPGAQLIMTNLIVQGEEDAVQGITHGNYLTDFTNFINYWEARTGTFEAFVVGSMLPQKFLIGSPLYSAAYAAIDRAHVAASLTIPKVRYSRGPDDRTANDNLHYQPAAVARLQGDYLGNTLMDAVGPSVTNPAELGTLVGTQLAILLTHNDPLGHATFHLTGDGADDAEFEISDPYITPTLRWAGNGMPPGAGNYEVQIQARDGAGNYGPVISRTLTVADEISPAEFFLAGDRGYVVDLNDLSTLWQDIAGTIPVTAAGQPVGRIQSKVSNGWVLTADANSTLRPTYALDTSGNGQLDFAGAQYLRSPDEVLRDPSGTAAWTCAVAVTAGAQAGEKNIIGDQADGTTSFLDFLQANNATVKLNMRFSGSSSNFSPAGTVFAGTPVIVASQYDAQYTAAGVFRPARIRNATATATFLEQNGGPVAGSANTCTKFVVGARYFAAASNQFTGKIGSFFVIDRALSDADRRVCEAWVANRSEATLA